MRNAMVNARLVGRSLFSVLLFAALCAPSLSFGWSWGHHHSPRPQLVVDGREVLFTVLPTVDKDHVFRAPVDFVHMLGGDYVVGKDADARWTPTLAISWRQVDPLTWEFALRPNVRFSDGSPFTSEDVVASVRRIPTIPNNPGPYTTNLRTITSTVAVDPLTIRVTNWVSTPLMRKF